MGAQGKRRRKRMRKKKRRKRRISWSCFLISQMSDRRLKEITFCQ